MTNEKIYGELQEIKEKLTYCHTEISHLGELKEAIRSLQDCVTSLKVNVGKLEVKSGVWGAIAGFVTAAVALIVAYFRNNV